MDAAGTSVVWVVGDRFESFAKLAGVRTYSALKDDLVGIATRSRVKVGQGLSAAERHELESVLGEPPVAPCDRALVHKRQARNVMLSAPIERAAGVYTASLCLDDACDDLADHLTGHHLQGAVLAEAARQMVLAVSEAFLLPEAKRFAMRFVTHAMEMTYLVYAFPLEVRVQLTIETWKRGAGGNFAATAVIAFEQNATKVAESRFRFAALDGGMMDDNETELARQALGVNYDLA